MRKIHSIQTGQIPPERLQFYCLAAASAIVFLFTILGGYKLIAYYYSNTFLMVPALIFFGITLTRKPSASGSGNLTLGVWMVVWYVFVKSIHRLQGMEAMSCSMFLCMYLLAFPYAQVMEDGEKQKGLTMAAKMFGCGAAITACFGLLSVLGRVPGFLESSIGFDGGRLSIWTHPNMTGCVYMVGATFCVGGFFRVRSRWHKAVLLLTALVQFALIPLTNSRTTVFTVGMMLGGMAFFAILRGGLLTAAKRPGGWNRIILAALAAVVVIGGYIFGATKLYEANYSRLTRIYIAQVEEARAKAEAEAEAAAAQTETVELTEQEVPKSETPKVRLPGGYYQHSLAEDMKSFNNRDIIWKASFRAMARDPQILLWGTGYADTAITESSSWHYIKHSHNSWIEVLLKMGIPGLAVALWITWIGIRKSLVMLFTSRDPWKICIAILVPCLMVTGFFEPYFFNGYPDYHMIEYIFFLLVGYLSQWKAEPV